MKPAEEFLKEKDIKTFGAIICDGQLLVKLLEEYAEKVAKNLHKPDNSGSFCGCKPQTSHWLDKKTNKDMCMKCGLEIASSS